MYTRILELNDQKTEYAMTHQVLDRSSRFYGGIIDRVSGVPRPNHGGTASDLASAVSSLLYPGSRYYRNAELLMATERMADFMLNRQHKDGTISLGSTNYHSPPDTGFVVSGMAMLYRVLMKDGWSAVQSIAAKVRTFLERSIPAMLTGGCHTPNHRWVLTSALANLYDLFGRIELVARAEEWLREGMDCTEDGEWTERSNGIYNSVSDVMLIYAADYLNRPELLDPIRRNLRMMMYLVHPDGEVVTDYSSRQDYGNKMDLSPYVLSYGLMAVKDRDLQFAAMFDLAVSGCSELNSINNHAMLGLLACPELQQLDVERGELPQHYLRILNTNHPAKEELLKMESIGHHGTLEHSGMHTSFGSPVVRYRDQERSATLLTRVPSFFSLRNGKAKLLAVHIWSSFSPGFVELTDFQLEGNRYYLGTTMEKGYYGPIPEQQLPSAEDSPTHTWYLLPHQHRPATHTQQHRIEVELNMSDESEWILQIKSDQKMEDVFTQIMFTFDQDSQLTGGALNPADHNQSYWTGGSIRCTSGTDWIEIDGGAFEHRLSVKRSVSPREGTQTVLVNLLSPFDNRFVIRMS